MWKSIFTIYTSVSIITHSIAQSNCGVEVRSTCSDKPTTKWNTKFVDRSLKEWMSSLTNFTSIQQQYVNQAQNYSKALKIIMSKKINSCIGVQYIANLDCSTKKSIGYSWRKPIDNSSYLFDDGFLYGREDLLGEMTGNLILNLIIK